MMAYFPGPVQVRTQAVRRFRNKLQNPARFFRLRAGPLQGDGSGFVKEPGGEGDDGFEQGEGGSDRDSHEPERERQKPNKGIENEGENGDGPAND
jgi:hypothetical protein